jgi:1,4-dihydroxy-2-naphthoate octaprenyltransferase
MALVGGLACHVSVNALNEYFDFKSGLDSRTERTPFSGGSGTLQAHPELAKQALTTGVVAAVIIVLVGIYFITVGGWSIVPLGLLGLVVIIAYTPWITRQPVLCLVAPGLGFGTFMVMGTDLVLTWEYTWTSFIASLVPFFLVSNLLLLNQFPDVEADKSVGRSHVPILFGRGTSSIIYGLFLLGAYLSIIIGVVLGYLPVASLLGLATLLIAVPAFRGARAYADDIPKLIPSMGQNVLINLLTPVLVAVGLFIA